MSINGRGEACVHCTALPQCEHSYQCPDYEPPLTADELRLLRCSVLRRQQLKQALEAIDRVWDGVLSSVIAAEVTAPTAEHH